MPPLPVPWAPGIVCTAVCTAAAADSSGSGVGWGGMRWVGQIYLKIYGFPLSILMKERNLFFFCPEEAAMGAESQQVFLGTHVLEGGKGWN